MSEAVCAGCRKLQSQLSTPLKRCSQCQQMKYCSKECQRTDWPRHKLQCVGRPAVQETARPARTTFRLVSRRGNYSDSDTILFLRKTLADIDDITITGPFRNPGSMVQHMKAILLGISQAGMGTICEIADDPSVLMQLAHIRAPLDADPTKFVLFEIIQQENPVMARHLPGPAYNVVSTVPFEPQESDERNSRAPSPHPRVKEMDVHGSFPSAEEAKLRLTEVVKEIKGGFKKVHRDQDDMHVTDDGSVACIVMGLDANNCPKIVVVQSSFDSGVIQYI